jgi:hypothetical protein
MNGSEDQGHAAFVSGLFNDARYQWTPHTPPTLRPPFDGQVQFRAVDFYGAVSDLGTVTTHIDVVNTAPDGQNDLIVFVGDPAVPGSQPVRVLGGTYTFTDVTGHVEQGEVEAAGVLANDQDVDNDPLNARVVTGPRHATAFQLSADGTFVYTPDLGEFHPTGRIVVFGGPGDDDIRLDRPVRLADWLYAGSGGAVLIGGSGPHALIAGSGSDRLDGRGGRNLLVVGHSSAHIVTHAGRDRVVRDPTVATNRQAIAQLLARRRSRFPRGPAADFARRSGKTS